MKKGHYFITGPLPSTPVPAEQLRPWDETVVVGRRAPRVDGYQRLSGAAIYPSDVVLPRMAYGAILRSPHAHAKVKRVDTSKAEAMPGVYAVIHDATPGADLPWHMSRRGPLSRLFDPHCRHEGQEVAAVAAESPQQAWDAVRAIDVEYEELPFVVDPQAALDDGAPAVHEGGNRAGEPGLYERGDVDAGYAAADVVLGRDYSTPCGLHTPMELHGCVAQWEADRLTVWESSQGVYSAQRVFAQALGLPLSHVRVIGHYVGGGFGSKLWPVKASVICALLARRTARPVKLFLSREETMLVAGNRPANLIRVSAGVKRDGTLTALEYEVIGTGGAYSGGGTSLSDWQVRDLYRCENVRTVSHNVYTHAGTQRPMRAPGHPQGSWALEQMLDELAHKIGIDPVELRLRNLTEISQARDGIPYTSTGFKDCLEEGAKEFGWKEARERPRGDGNWVRGVGMAGCTWIVGDGGPPATVVVKGFADGSVNLNLGASDIGTGTKTIMAMVVAEELGVAPEQIQIENADTATTQYATASGGSKTVPTEAPAVRAAAIDCKRQILEMAARQMELPPSDLVLEDGTVTSRTDSEKQLPLGSIEELRNAMVVVGVGYRGPNPEGKAICPFGAQFCEVEVHRRTGEVRVLRFVAAHDSGRVMNRMTYDNQVYGGITMGIGFGLTERRELDAKQTGKVLNRAWHEYKIPTALDVPADMTSVPIDPGDDECNSAGAKGLGEPVTIPTAAAIANAVFHATGVRVADAPITPTRLAELLATGRSSQGRG
jgi:xanthine dehydrogenase YagR molybdenum-binding subunit